MKAESQSGAISLEFSNGKLILKQGHLVLFTGAIAQPETITIVLQNVPLGSGSSVTESVNGISKTTWVLSAGAPETVGRSSQRQHRFF